MGINLITGGMGFLGAYLARHLVDSNEKVVLFQRRNQLPKSAADIEGKVDIFSGDICNWIHLLDVTNKYKVDCIYHSAALLSRECDASAWEGFRVNILGTMNILEAARILNIPNVIFVSSGATYGMWEPPRHVYDDAPQKADNMYTTTKICCERLGEQYYRQYCVNFRANRYAMVVGPTRQISYYYGDWTGVIERTAQGKPYVVHVNPKSLCSYIYVKEAARALVELKKADDYNLRQRVYNVQGFMATVTEVVESIKKYLPEAQITFEWDKSEQMLKANRGMQYEMDNTSAFEDFGYKTQFLANEMVKDFINEVMLGRSDL